MVQVPSLAGEEVDDTTARTAFNWIGDTIAAHKPTRLVGIEVSERLYDAGVRGVYAGVEINKDCDFLQDENIRLSFVFVPATRPARSFKLNVLNSLIGLLQLSANTQKSRSVRSDTSRFV